MSSLPTPPRLGPRLPLPPAPRDGARDDDESTLRPGDLLEGRYQIEKRIGEGGVGVVYRALQLKLHRRVAVKLLQQDVINDEPLRPRFQQEALTLAALSHPNIVALQDYGLVRGRPYLVMELLEGRTLRDILDEEGALPPLRALGLVRQLLLALAYAHSLGIVHRDLKPANLIVQALPACEHVMVLDFGMVKLLPGSYLDRGEQLTRLGFTHGTPAYMSPEHALGRDVDGRSDLYAVGILLFELVTGDKPFDGEPHDVLRHHLTSPVPRLAERRPELAALPALQALIDRALEKEREARHGSALELLRDVDALLAGSPAHVPAPRAPARALSFEGPFDDADPSGRRALPQALGRYAALLSHHARRARTRVRPQLERARGRLSALGARVRPALRRASDAAWAQLRPRIVQAADRISRAALDAKARLERPGQPTLALPRPRAEAELVPGDATVVDMSPLGEGARSSLATRPLRTSAPVIAARSGESEGTAATLPGASATAEPLLLGRDERAPEP